MNDKPLRIGVDVRYEEWIFGRGMGRYTLQQLHAVIRATPDDAYVLCCHHRIPPSLEAFRAYPNVTLDNRFRKHPLSPFIRKAWLAEMQTRQLDYIAQRLKLDVWHIPILFSFMTPIPAQFNAPAVVMTVYDFIPLLYEPYFPQERSAKIHYMRGIERMKSANRLIAISEATKRDAMQILGVDGDQIAVAYPAVDEAFMRLDEAEIRTRLMALWSRLAITPPQRYFLTVTDHFYTKNLDTLLRAYANLPADVRQNCPLVVTFNISDKDRLRFSALVDDLGATGQVIFTGRVSEDELVTLYNGALMTVYPSRYEGFGYPIAEAMRCGSPVLTTDAASMPEVAGDVAIMVNPEDADAMTGALVRAYTHPETLADMREKGYAQADKFNLEALADATRHAYQMSAVQQPTPPKRVSPINLEFMLYAFIMAVWYVYVGIRWSVGVLIYRAYKTLKPVKTWLIGERKIFGKATDPTDG